jgi:predicted CoA-substrate-specific enzyme activase
MGGQDCKAIRCGENGDVTNLAMNEKCAAGTGRYLERIAGLLDVPLDEIGPRSLQPVKGAATINSTCTLFAEFDIVKLLRQGKYVNDILAGANDSLTRRIVPLLDHVEVEPAFAISGGVAKNMGVVDALKHYLKIDISVPDPPDTVSALRAAIIAGINREESK